MCPDILLDSFRKLYSELGFIDGDGNCLPLHSCCVHGKDCWSGPYESMYRKPADKDAAISRPWVGGQYQKLGLWVVGINLNECGGEDSLVGLVEEARKELGGGARKVTFRGLQKESFGDSKYSGTLLWHRVGCYATAFCEAKGIYDKGFDLDGYPPPEAVRDAYDYIAYTNHVKCSPNSNNSAPSPGMWEHCGRHVLRKEMALLKPTDILLLGKSDNLTRFQMADILDNPPVFGEEGKNSLVRRAKSSIGGMPVRVFVVPHPAKGVGMKGKEILSDLRELLRYER